MKNYKTIKDEDLINFIKKNKDTEKCLKILIERHSGLCIDMVNSYICVKKHQSLRQELINEKDFQIYNAALKYDSTKGAKFSTYLGNEIKWRCLNLCNKIKRRATISVEENLIDYFNNNQSEHLAQKKESNDIFNEVLDLTKSERDSRIERIFYLRYVVGKNNSVMPWKNISKELGMSIQGCINIHDAAIKKIKNKIK